MPDTKPSGLTHDELRKRREQIAGEVAKGYTVASVAGYYSVSEKLVEKACREFGVTFPERPRRKNLSQDELFRILAMLIEREKSYEAIADEIGTTRQAVGRIAQTAKRHRLIGSRAVWKRKKEPAAG